MPIGSFGNMMGMGNMPGGPQMPQGVPMMQGQGQPPMGLDAMQPQGGGEVQDPQQLKAQIQEMFQGMPDDQLMQMVQMDPEQFLQLFMQEFQKQGLDEGVAFQMAGMALDEMQQAAQMKFNQTLGQLNPNLMKGEGQGEAPQQQGPPQPRPSMAGGL